MGKPAMIEAPRSPEREALAEAIARYERSVERARRVDSLRDVRLVGPAQEKLDAAKAALAKAIAQEGTRTVATILGEQPSGIFGGRRRDVGRRSARGTEDLRTCSCRA